MAVNDFQPGQIWEVSTGRNVTARVLILNCHQDFANVVFVNDSGGTYTLLSGDGVIDPRRMTFKPYRDMTCYLGSVADSELEDIRDVFLRGFGEDVPERQMDTKILLLEQKCKLYEQFISILSGDRR